MSRSLRSQVRQLQQRIRELEAELKDVDEKIQHRNRRGLLSSSRPKVDANAILYASHSQQFFSHLCRPQHSTYAAILRC